MTNLVIALDIDKNKALRIVDNLTDFINFYKIGHKLFTSNPEIINIINRKGKKVILDLKYHDIPSVVGFAIEEVIKKYAPFGLTLHISGGKKMLEQAVETKQKFNSKIQPILFGVTVLTSLDTTDLKTIGINVRKVSDQVIRLSKIAKECGLDGVVCSGYEIEYIKKICGKKFLTLVPGLSLDPKAHTGQKRSVTITDAIKKKADYIVVGRTIYDSEDPIKTVKEILQIKWIF